MAIDKSHAFVIRSIDFGESDKIITVFSREYGKFSLIAKAARKTDSRFGSALDLLTLNELIFYQGENLKFLSDADQINSFSHLKADLDKLEISLRMARALNQLTEESQKEPKIFWLFENVLKHLQRSSKNYQTFELGFLLKLIEILGVAPQLMVCVKCEKDLQDEGQIYFAPSSGGAVCEKCRSNGAIAIEKDIQLSLAKISKLPPHRLDRIALSNQSLAISKKLLQRFISYHFRPLKLFGEDPSI